MPGNQEITRVFMRVDTHDEALITKFIEVEKINVTYVVFHTGATGENPHFHLAGTLPAIAIQTLRNHTKSHFKQEKAGYSVKEWKDSEKDIEDVLSYPYHEKEARFFINNVSDSEQVKAKARNEIIGAKKEIIEKKGPTQWDIIEDIRAELDRHPHFNFIEGASIHEYRQRSNFDIVIDIILNHLNKNRIKFGMFDIEKWFVTVVSNKPKFRDQIKEKIFSKVYS